ncbi:MAG: 50S ribosomal protein L16 [Candidatus Omnitrophota bacterium]|nr:50S ribosomal protein L16 [Candidatus Omnitrophota bacterium]
MPMMPKRVKYRKAQRGSRAGLATRGDKISFGEFGLKVLENGWIKNTQIEAARVALTRRLRRGGRLWIRIFPHKPVTKKPAETRQGKGKGDVDHWVAVVRRGKVLFELGGISEELARISFRLAAYKLPLRTKFISRAHKV